MSECLGHSASFFGFLGFLFFFWFSCFLVLFFCFLVFIGFLVFFVFLVLLPSICFSLLLAHRQILPINSVLPSFILDNCDLHHMAVEGDNISLADAMAATEHLVLRELPSHVRTISCLPYLKLSWIYASSDCILRPLSYLSITFLVFEIYSLILIWFTIGCLTLLFLVSGYFLFS